jgi:two-component system, OmpR family, sensor kinase
MNPPIGDRLPVADRLARVRGALRRIPAWLDQQTAIRHRIPIRWRIALFGAAVVAITVVIFSVLVYVLVVRSLETQQDTTLTRRGDQAWATVVSSGGRLAPFRLFLPADLNVSPELFIQIFDSQGTSVVSSGKVRGVDPQLPPDVLAGAPYDHGALKTTQAEGGPLVRVYVRSVGPNGYVLVGQPLFGIRDLLSDLRLVLIAGALLSLLGAAAASWLVAGRALRPLDAMASTAEDIGRTQDLSRRLPETGPRDEVGRLERSFNEMLRQLEDAYLRLRSALVAQRRFVADASHELRTPLTTIRGNIGLLINQQGISSEDRVAALYDIAGESERMSRMVQDLLTLARADAGYHLDKSPIDLRPIMQEVSRQAQTLQPTRRIQLLDGVPAPVQGNPDAIRQLLWILIDNAFKHTAEGGQIQLQLQNGQQVTRLTVADDGPGIASEDLERIFERFYQADTSRSDEGTGLGLAIARWIAREHGGRVFAANRPGGGAAFTVELPVAKS